MDFFFFKEKTAYEIRPRDWSSDVCSSDLHGEQVRGAAAGEHLPDLLGRRVGVLPGLIRADAQDGERDLFKILERIGEGSVSGEQDPLAVVLLPDDVAVVPAAAIDGGAGAPVRGLDRRDVQPLEV